jgi:ABC-type transporter Mla subunit MlaD
MLDTYFSSRFLILHATLLVIYLITFVYSWVLLRRESLALNSLEREPADVAEALQTLSATTEIMPEKSALKKQLKRVFVISSQGGELQMRAITEQVTRNISWLDETIRYCINGFVVVGLMGTLYAFYEMWHSAGAAALPVSNEVYLENMARALSISFFGLILALAANFFFSLLRAARQRLIGNLSDYLNHFDNLVPLDSKANILLTRLFDPLNNLVEQLTIQNDRVLKKLTDTVDERTEQLNKLIEDTTNSWKSTIQEFKQETLTAVGSLNHASTLLANSSRDVAGTMKDVTATMKDVSRGLERTKDIGRIIEQMEATSTSLITRLSEKLEKATQAWAQKLSLTVREQRRALEQHYGMLEKMTKGLTARAVGDFKSMTGQVTQNLAQMQTIFDAKTDAVASKWMTKMSDGYNETKSAMSEIVNGWHTTVTGTAASINTALDSSSRLTNDTVKSMELLHNEISELQSLTNSIVGNMGTLHNEINELQRTIAELEQRAGAPLLLKEVSSKLTETTEEFSTINQTLQALADSITQNPALSELRVSVETNSVALKDLRDSLRTPEPPANGNQDVVQAISNINQSLSVAIRSVEESIRQMPPPPRPTSTSPRHPPRVPPEKKPSLLHPIKRWRLWREKRSRRISITESDSNTE